MRLRLALALLAAPLLLTGCLSAPDDVQAEFERGQPNHYRPAGLVGDKDEQGGSR